MFSALKYLKSSVKIANKFSLTESVFIKSALFENSIIFYTTVEIQKIVLFVTMISQWKKQVYSHCKLVNKQLPNLQTNWKVRAQNYHELLLEINSEYQHHSSYLIELPWKSKSYVSVQNIKWCTRLKQKHLQIMFILFVL